MVRILFTSLIAAALCVSTGCKRDPMPAPTEDDRDYVGKDAQVHVSQLRFADAAEGQRFNKLRDCFTARTQDEGWNHYPLRKIGNFVEEDWCRGPGSEHNCGNYSFRNSRGSEWFDVYTLHYPEEWPEVFGLGVSSGMLPAEDEWGASFAYHTRGKSIVGDGVSVSFHRFAASEIVEEVHLGDVVAFEAEETRVAVVAPGGPDAELALLIASPESLRDTAFARYDALLTEVASQIEAGNVRKCVYGEYHGDGIPPECHLTPLSEEERCALKQRAQAEIGGQRDAVATHHAQFHALLLDRVDFRTCW